MEQRHKSDNYNKKHEDFLDAIAAVALIILSVSLIIFILNDQPY
jgi:hypothetical protein